MIHRNMYSYYKHKQTKKMKIYVYLYLVNDTMYGRGYESIKVLSQIIQTKTV